MTDEERIGQLQQADGHFDVIGPFQKQNIGSVLSVIGTQAGIVHNLAKETRLGIPVLIGVDAIHGHNFWPGATVFPVQLGAAQSWDEEVMEMMGNVTAYEMRNTGPAWTFAPVLCIARDLRWGRVGETFGEDPFLIGKLAAAMIRGLQGPNGPSSDPDKVLATAKHYAGYSETEGGRDASEADLSIRKLKSFFLPQFEKAVEAKVGSFMTGYQSIEGLPSTANKWLLKENLKQDWGFEGFLVTDYNNVGYMVTNQQIVATYEEAAKLAVESGNDLMMSTPEFYDAAVNAVKSGMLSMKDVNESCRRILETKFKLGLFEDIRDYDPKKIEGRIGSEFSRAQSQRAAEESLILLKNDNNYLPLDESKISKIAVIGPNADNALQQSGDWSLGTGQLSIFGEHPRNCTITVVDAFKERFKGTVTYEMGCGIEPGEKGDQDAAIKAAQEADATVVVIGDRLMYYGEMRSVGTLDLQGGQIELLRALKATGKKFIIVVISYKPLIIPEDIREAAAAIIWQFCPGMLGGRATAKAILGDLNPSGRLTISMPRHVGQQPLYYYQLRGAHGDYADMTAEPAWAFGYGLTYSEIEYVSAELDKSQYSKTDEIKATVTIKNKGTRDAVEVVQAYVSDLITSVTWVNHELKGFARVPIKAGETKTVEIVIKAAECSIVNAAGDRVVEPGDFELQIGKASNDILFTKQFCIQ